MGEIKLGLCLLLLSCYGYLQYLRKFLRLEFCLGLLFSGIGGVLFLAGILNLLPEAAWCIWLCGLLLAGRSVLRKESVKNVLSYGTLFFLLAAVFFLFLLRGSEFTGYDNFSHWAMVSRLITQQGRFPNYNDYNILFPSYPLGSAAFIFYVTKMAGHSAEWMHMYAQALLMIGMLVSLFAFARGPVQSLAVAVCAVFLLCGNGSVYDLLVDCLLPVTAISAAATLIYYNSDLRQKLWVAVPYALFLVSIKNSGIFFVLLLYGYLWFSLRQQNVSLKIWLSLLSVPVLSLLVWQRHVQAMFHEGMLTKHALSLSYYRSIVGGKSFTDIYVIVRRIASKVLSVSNHALWLLLAVFVLWLLCKRIAVSACPETTRILILSVVAYILYQAGTLGMYLFSMPLEEALILAEYNRYHQTIVLFLAGLFLFEFMLVLAAFTPPLHSKKWITPILLAMLLVFSYWMIHPSFSSLKKQHLAGSERAKFDQLIEQYDIQPGGNYLVLTRPDRYDAGYLEHLTKYLLSAQIADVVPPTAIEGFDLTVYDYVVIFEETDEANSLLFQLSGSTGPVACLHGTGNWE